MGGFHRVAALGLALSIFSILILIAQLLLTQKRRRDATNYQISLERILKAIRKGSSTAFAAQFILTGSLLSMFWLIHVNIYKLFIPLRHLFFLTWHISVLRHWVYVFDPLGRRVHRERMDTVWLILRVTLGLGSVLIIVLLFSDTEIAKMEASDLNEYVWSFSSILVIYSSLVFSLFLKRMLRSCNLAMSKCRKYVLEEDQISFGVVLKSPIVDIRYLMQQNNSNMYLTYLVHLNSLHRCMGFSIVSIFCGFTQEVLWFVVLANGKRRMDVFENENWLRAIYYWLPELIPFCYWLWVLSTAKYVFVDTEGHTPDIKTSEDIVRTSSFVADEGLLQSLSNMTDTDESTNRLSFQQVDTGSKVFSLQKSKKISRTSAHSSYFSWITDSVLIGGENNFQFAKHGANAPLESLRHSVVAAHRASASLNKDILFDIKSGRFTNSAEKYREIFVSGSEMVLLDKVSDIPVGSIFSGQIYFVVLSVAANSPSSSDRAIITTRETVWVELGRSELVDGRFNPDFKKVFTIPRDDSEDPMRMWRLEIYNVVVSNQYINIPRFSVGETKLNSSFLAGLAYFSGKDLQAIGLCGDVALPSNEFREIVRPIISSPYSKALLRFGGAISFRIRNSEPYCQSVPMLMTKRSDRGTMTMRSARTTNVEDLESHTGFEKDETKQQEVSAPFMLQSYVLRVAGLSGRPEHTIYIREECIESPYSLSVPLAFLNALLVRRTRETAMFGKYIMYMNDEDFSKSWLSDLLEKKIVMLRVYVAAIENYTNRQRLLSNGDFKSSKAKSDHELRYMPVNLHLQALVTKLLFSHSAGKSARLDEDGESVNHIVSVGAFAAHSLRFKEGGIWQYLNKYQKRKLELEPSSGLSEEADRNLSGPQYASSMDIWHLNKIPVDPQMQHLAHAASERIDICLSQCLSALVTGFVARIQLLCAVKSQEELENFCALGMLVQFESLLSTHGKESGMLQDMYCTIRCLDCVQFMLHRASPQMETTTADVKMHWAENGDSEGTSLIIDLGVVASCFNALPISIQEGATIPVVPVMFTVGINELQSIANMSGSTALHLQEVINIESLCRLKEYIELRHKIQKGLFDEMLTENDLCDAVTKESSSPFEESLPAKNRLSVGKDFGGSEITRESILHSLKEVGEIQRQLSEPEPLSSPILSKIGRTPLSEGVGTEQMSKWSRVRILRKSILMTDEGRKLTSGMLLLDPSSQEEGEEEGKSEKKATNKIGSILEVAKKQLPTFAETAGSDVDSDDEDFTGSGAEATFGPTEETRPSIPEQVSIVSDSASSIELSCNKGGAGLSTVAKISDLPLAPVHASISAADASFNASSSRRLSYVPSLPTNLPYTVPAVRKRMNEDSNEVFNKMLVVEEGDEDYEDRLSLKRLSRHQSAAKRTSALNITTVNMMFNELNDVVGQSVGAAGKPWQILSLAGNITRLVDGIRLTSCKSAKDRTGMSITLEEVSIVKDRYKLGDDEFKELLETTRSHGVRLKIAEKNVGKAKFAFNTFQRTFLPEEYAPPLCTIGSVVS